MLRRSVVGMAKPAVLFSALRREILSARAAYASDNYRAQAVRHSICIPLYSSVFSALQCCAAHTAEKLARHEGEYLYDGEHQHSVAGKITDK